jgi:vacuolar protein sorting-associated protein 35
MFGKGGPYRLRYSLPPVVFATYKLLGRYSALRNEADWDAKIKKIFHFCMSTISVLKSETENYELALKLMLEVRQF